MSAAILYLMRNRKFDFLHQRWADNVQRIKAALEAGNPDRALDYGREIERGAHYAGCRDVMSASTIVRMVAIVYDISEDRR